jgi:hypothetical protein
MRVTVFNDRGVERVAQAGLEIAVEPCQLQRSLAIGAGKCNVPRQLNLGFGQGTGLVGTQNVHASEIANRGEALDDDMRLRHAQCAARERHRDDHWQQFGREPNREGDGKQKAR